VSVWPGPVGFLLSNDEREASVELVASQLNNALPALDVLDQKARRAHFRRRVDGQQHVLLRQRVNGGDGHVGLAGDDVQLLELAFGLVGDDVEVGQTVGGGAEVDQVGFDSALEGLNTSAVHDGRFAQVLADCSGRVGSSSSGVQNISDLLDDLTSEATTATETAETSTETESTAETETTKAETERADESRHAENGRQEDGSDWRRDERGDRRRELSA